MKQFCIIIIILATLFGLRHFQVIELSAAKLEYSTIQATLYNPDWYGSPYVVKERSSFNRWYEDASIKLLPSEQKELQEVVDDLSDYQYHIHLGEGRHLYASGDSIEICLDHISYELVEMESGLFTASYELTIDSELDYYVDTHLGILPQDGHAFQMKAKINTSGLTTQEFLEYNFKTLFLYELDRLSTDFISGYSVSQTIKIEE